LAKIRGLFTCESNHFALRRVRSSKDLPVALIGSKTFPPLFRVLVMESANVFLWSDSSITVQNRKKEGKRDERKQTDQKFSSLDGRIEFLRSVSCVCDQNCWLHCLEDTERVEWAQMT